MSDWLAGMAVLGRCCSGSKNGYGLTLTGGGKAAIERCRCSSSDGNG